MSSIQNQIQQAASQNAQLLQGLHETDSAPSQLPGQVAYIKDLDKQITDVQKRVNSLKNVSAKELKDHEKYRDSTLRRFAHKASGRKEKFAEKAAKEEKEYFDAVQAQKSAEDELAYAKHLKAEADTQRQKLETDTKRHNDLQAELDALYNSIFAGYTPEFPDEDAKENACNASYQHFSGMNQNLEREKHILYLLGQMVTKLSQSRASLDNAYSMSQWDMFGGGTLASMQKRNDLERADSSIQQVRMLQDQLRHIAPEIADLGAMNIATGSIWSDVVFDNIFTDMDMHGKIKDSISQIDAAGNKCSAIIRQREDGLKNIQGQVYQANEDLKRKRVELQQAREDAFSKVLAGGQVGSGLGSPPPAEYAPPSYAPPAYSA